MDVQDKACETPKKIVLSVSGFAKHQITNNFETPRSNHHNVPTHTRNPFDSVHRERLGSNFLSPSLFTKITPTKSSEVIWTIDELSKLKPVEIDASASQQFEHEHDDFIEAAIQSKIDKYFSMPEILPSPMMPACEPAPLITSDDDQSPVRTLAMSTSASQTILSLPPILPKDVEEVLKPYFTFTENQQHSHLTSKLFQRLFAPSPCSNELEVVDKPVEEYSFVPASPCVNKENLASHRNFGTPITGSNIIQQCNLSPISMQSTPRENVRTCQVVALECSYTVPDTENMSLDRSDNENASRMSQESCSDLGTANWDLEYNQLPTPSHEISYENIDVSTSNTPKLRSINSQRKKLSNSFVNEVKMGCDADEQMQSFIQQSQKGESGYQTGCTAHFDSESVLSEANISPIECQTMWESFDFTSSTPTKRKQFLKRVVSRNESAGS